MSGLSETWVIARRAFLQMRRYPLALVDATAQPIMFVLLFAFVFGGAISTPDGGSYREFLMSGIFAQTLVFGTLGVALGLAYDRTSGAVYRFQSMPIARWAPLAGHALANSIRSIIPIALMTATGLAIGWRIHTDVGRVLEAYGLMFAFAFAMIWIGVMLATLVSGPEGVQGVAFVLIFPLTFLANTFVPLDSLPGALHTVAEWNPISAMATSLRHLFGNPGGTLAQDGPWPLEHPVAYVLVWIAGIVAVCVPVAVAAYQRSIRV